MIERLLSLVNIYTLHICCFDLKISRFPINLLRKHHLQQFDWYVQRKNMVDNCSNLMWDFVLQKQEEHVVLQFETKMNNRL